jgi:GNAT superfamily N-acetyltransferase
MLCCPRRRLILPIQPSNALSTPSSPSGRASGSVRSFLWVTPEARNTGVVSRLVQAAADQAIKADRTKLYYWVSTENGRAIGFASNGGFRVTSQRRTARIENKEFGDQEVAFVLSLANDPHAVATSTPARLTSQPGPQ